MTLTELVKATYATVGQDSTDLQLAMVVDELSGYPMADVLASLTRCRRELRKLTLADILDRLPGGHPGPEEAWGIVSTGLTRNARTLVEDATIVWTNEMRAAYGIAAALADDLVAARMAFKETYTRIVSEARAQRLTPAWSVSLGNYIHGREGAVLEAVQKGRLTLDHARRLVPALPEPSRDALAIVERILY